MFGQALCERIRPRRVRERDETTWTVFYDGLCPLCVRSMVTLDALDLRGRLRFLDFESAAGREPPTDPPVGAPAALDPEELRHAMHVVGPSGRVYRGYFAFRALARPLPACWPLLPFLHLPGASRIGVSLYRLVARSRGRTACRAGACVS